MRIIKAPHFCESYIIIKDNFTILVGFSFYNNLLSKIHSFRRLSFKRHRMNTNFVLLKECFNLLGNSELNLQLVKWSRKNVIYSTFVDS